MSVSRNPRGQPHRLERDSAASIMAWRRPLSSSGSNARDVVVDCGWGRLVFGHTFDDNERLAQALRDEKPGKRDVALYIAEPHVVLAFGPQDLFLDPSHTYRMYLEHFRPPPLRAASFIVRKLMSQDDAWALAEIYAKRRMVPVDPVFVWNARTSRLLTHFVAADAATGQVVGTVTGVDHKEAFDDPENGSSLWALAVDPQTPHPGVGQALVAHLCEHYFARERAYVDLSVMHDNLQAIRLYEKFGFCRVPVFCVKRKNPINEPLYTAGPVDDDLNPYAAIITREARRRGIAVDVIDAQGGYVSLTFGGRTVVCRESLSELTTAIALSRCDDKRVTRRVLVGAGLSMPEQHVAGDWSADLAFLERHGRIVVKPVRGEQGAGVSVDVRSADELERALARARRHSDVVVIEQLVEGFDLRVVVIDYRVVAAAIRRPPEVTGTGEHTVRELIEKHSRRRSAATGGESRIPLDEETARTVRAEGHELDAVLPVGRRIAVRRTANLHTGGTIHDVTRDLHPRLGEAAERAAEALNIPVVGLDLIVPAVDGPDYYVIEANERPGLANHEPRPTAERFIDLLFPQTTRSP
jgi:GNAT-family acetyltransferase (TIGR03103 family)